ncbi:MAG: carboxypeptidase regulatory-like domain-containing protein [Longimicrobiales bacterium]
MLIAFRYAAITITCGMMTAKFSAAQVIRGRVVDEAARAPLVGATATLLSGGVLVVRAATDASGFFLLRPSATGDHEITVEMIGYTTGRHAVRFDGVDLTVPAFVMKASAIRLDPVETSVDTRGRRGAAVGFARSSHVLAGARLAELAAHGLSPRAAVRELGAGLRVREFKGASGEPVFCVESVRRMRSLNPNSAQASQRERSCEWPVIVIDGIKVADRNCDFRSCQPDAIFRDLRLDIMESFEYLSPVEAGQQYGLEASASGALVIWTRGRGPHRDSARNRKTDAH